ncbi:hypothetical protein EJB05_06471 [Eragrostis curvula]|uniref:Uncharacterized protein n=1 Tax=Eragrostis curvula TaxID=38414 RepID=A0A5J9WFB1_9POAL|nr:hypothetical protein EJB05_06471 [Eragrostis curvula]
MIVSLLTGAGLFNISDFVPALARLDLQGVQAKLRRIHLQFDALITKLLEEHAATAEVRSREGRQDFVDKLRASMDDDEEGETITEVNIKGLIFCSGSSQVAYLPDAVKLDMAETFGLALPKAVPLRAVVTPRIAPEAYAT